MNQNGVLVSKETEYTFYVSNDMTVEAVYEEAEQKAEALLTNVITTKRTDGTVKYDVNFVGQLVLPEGRFLRGKIFATIVKDGKEETLYSVEKRAVSKTAK